MVKNSFWHLISLKPRTSCLLMLTVSRCLAHSRHSSIYWCTLEQRRSRLGGTAIGLFSKGRQDSDVPSAAPHYNLLGLNLFSTPPTFHIFLVIRQQSMMLCVPWVHCFSSLIDFYTFFFIFLNNRNVTAVSAFLNKFGAQFSFTYKTA